MRLSGCHGFKIDVTFKIQIFVLCPLFKFFYLFCFYYFYLSTILGCFLYFICIYVYIYRKEDGKEDLDNLNNTSKLDATINPLIETTRFNEEPF